MADVQTGEFSRWRSSLGDAHQLLKVAVWDTGPSKPTKPTPPAVSKAVRPGSVEYDIEQIELKQEIIPNYEAQLAHYIGLSKEYEQWHRNHNGPVTLQMWSCDWRDAQHYDMRSVAEGRQPKRRYFKFDPRQPRQGLPVGTEPGRSHAEQIERQAAADQALEVAQADDPQFGSQR